MDTLITNQSTQSPSSISLNITNPLNQNPNIQEIFILDSKSFLPKFLIAFLSLWLISEITETPFFSNSHRLEVYEIQHAEKYQNRNISISNSFEERKKVFLAKKHLIISQYLINNGIPTTSQLSKNEALSLNAELHDLFISHLIQNNPNLSEAEKDFFMDSKFNIVLNALHEQWKNHIPFSILIAKTITSTNYGRVDNGNNLFAFKDVNGNLKSYPNPEESFDDFSNLLISKSEYANLFVGGKNYIHWANQINTYDCNERDFAVFQSGCGQTLINTISKLNLDLLDY